jgi:isoleucyl-tRNA synthetase
MRLSSLGRSARSKAGIKVRQPLAEAVVSVPTEAEREYVREIGAQLENELNVRSIKDASQVGGIVRSEVRPNLRMLGPKYGSRVAEISRALAAVDATEVALDVESGNQIELAGFSILPEELLVTQTLLEGYVSSSEAGYTVAITTDITPELALEGLARELVHRVQDMRRSAGFDIADHIVTYYQGSPALDEVVAAHGDYVRQETLSRELINGPPVPEAYSETQNFDGNEVVLAVKKEG